MVHYGNNQTHTCTFVLLIQTDRLGYRQYRILIQTAFIAHDFRSFLPVIPVFSATFVHSTTIRNHFIAVNDLLSWFNQGQLLYEPKGVHIAHRPLTVLVPSRGRGTFRPIPHSTIIQYSTMVLVAHGLGFSVAF